MTAQRGEDHLGDQNKFLPTVHGFDEFYGNLYHLNAEEEPEQPDYRSTADLPEVLRSPRRPGVRPPTSTTPPRTALRPGRQADHHRHRSADPQADGDRGGGPARAILDFIDRAHQAERPFLLWHNTTRMHVWTRLSERWKDKTGLGVYADGMAELDWVVGELLKGWTTLGSPTTPWSSSPPTTAARSSPWPDGGTSRSGGEGPGLGGRLPGAFRDPLAGNHPRRSGAQRDPVPGRRRPDNDGRSGCSRRQGEAAGGIPGGRRTSECALTGITSCPT